MHQLLGKSKYRKHCLCFWSTWNGLIQSTPDISKLKFTSNYWYFKVNYLVPDELLRYSKVLDYTCWNALKFGNVQILSFDMNWCFEISIFEITRVNCISVWYNSLKCLMIHICFSTVRKEFPPREQCFWKNCLYSCWIILGYRLQIAFCRYRPTRLIVSQFWVHRVYWFFVCF